MNECKSVFTINHRVSRFSRYVHGQHTVPPTATDAAVNDGDLVWIHFYWELVTVLPFELLLLYILSSCWNLSPERPR